MSETKMTDQRKGEIAIIVVKYRFGQNGIYLSSGARRDIGNLVKDTGIQTEELMEFFKVIFGEMTQEFFEDSGNKK